MHASGTAPCFGQDFHTQYMLLHEGHDGRSILIATSLSLSTFSQRKRLSNMMKTVLELSTPNVLAAHVRLSSALPRDIRLT